MRRISLALAVLAGGCGPDNVVETVPAELVGVWRTTAPRYAERAFRIDPKHVVFQTGAGESDFTMHPIRRVTAERDQHGLLYTFEYAVASDVHTFGIYYEAGPPPGVRLRNQREMVWRRTSR